MLSARGTKHAVAWLVAIALCGAATAAEPALCTTHERFTVLLHGGFAGSARGITPAHTRLMRDVTADAKKRLAAGATALDVVVEAIARMEDSGILDAGKGSYYNTAGFTENDASLMEGHTGRAGAVAAMQTLKNPIRAARIVMDETPHVFFVGTTGETTLRELGAEAVPDPKTYFKEYTSPGFEKPAPRGAERDPKHGTVGAAVLDRCGHLAAGTSTGGTYGKMPGRVGDSPIIGASTFANERYALSATGVGEYFIRRSATRDIAVRAEYMKIPLQQAADHVVKNLIGEIDRAEGAIIAVSAEGEIVLSSNGYGVLYGHASASTDVTVGAELK